MTFYKVTNNTRTVRKIVFRVQTVAELKREGQAKLNLDQVRNVVLEEDGCELDDDTPLDIFPKGQLFLLLEVGQQWCPTEPPALTTPEQNLPSPVGSEPQAPCQTPADNLGTEPNCASPQTSTPMTRMTPMQATPVTPETPKQATQRAEETPMQATQRTAETPMQATKSTQETLTQATQKTPVTPTQAMQRTTETPTQSMERTPKTPMQTTPVTPRPGTSSGSELQQSHSEEDEDIVGTVTDPLSLQVLKTLESMPLPVFFGELGDGIKAPNPDWKTLWCKVVEQSAWHFWPTLRILETEAGTPGQGQTSSQAHYLTIGRRMLKKYPELRLAGKKPWSAFNKSLAIKIRKIRQDMKIKSQGGSASKKTKKARQLTFHTPRCDSVDEEECSNDVECHLEALKREWQKPEDKRSQVQVRLLMKFTQSHRRELLRAHPDGQLAPILDMYPCLQLAANVVHEVTLRYGEDKVREMSSNVGHLKNFLLQESKVDTFLDAIRFAEKQVGATKGRYKAQPLFEIHEDTPDNELKQKLESTPGSSPKVVCFKRSGLLAGCFIVADEETIVCDTTNIEEVVIQLMSMYYIFDLEYPLGYCMVLAFLQSSVWGEAYSSVTTQGYKFLLKSLEVYLERLGKDNHF